MWMIAVVGYWLESEINEYNILMALEVHAHTQVHVRVCVSMHVCVL